MKSLFSNLFVLVFLLVSTSTIGRSLEQQLDTASLSALITCVQFVNTCERKTYQYWLNIDKLADEAANYQENYPKSNNWSLLQLKDLNYTSRQLKVHELADAAKKQLANAAEVEKEELLREIAELDAQVARMEQSYVRIQAELAAKSYQEDSVKGLFALLHEIVEVFNYTDAHKDLIYQLARHEYEQQVAGVEDNSWLNSWKTLQIVIDEGYELTLSAKAFYAGDVSAAADTSAIMSQIALAKGVRDQNLEGLLEFGSHDDHDPYSKYNHVLRLSEKLAADSHSGGRLKYVISGYNNVVDYLNDFGDLADIPLLPALRQSYFYQSAKQESAVLSPEVKEVPSEDLQIDMTGFATNHLTLLLDVSGSMHEKSRLPALKHDLLKFPKYMRQEDKLSIVTFTGKVSTLLEGASFQNIQEIERVVNELESAGHTNIAQGLKTALDVSKKNFITEGNNRVVLATDGEFEFTNFIKEIVKEYKQAGVPLTIFYFGTDEGRAADLKKMAQITSGHYYTMGNDQVAKSLQEELQAVAL